MSKSLRDIETLKGEMVSLTANLNQLASTAQASDENIIQVINAQAKQLQNLTAIVVAMHRRMFPEKYDAQGNLIKESNATNHSPIVLTP